MLGENVEARECVNVCVCVYMVCACGVCMYVYLGVGVILNPICKWTRVFT